MKPVKSWRRLDNAAKIFPPTSSKRDSKVFRFVCELYETVDPAILQRALNKTLTKFPFYQSILKKGFFWYYFEDTTLQPVVTEESEQPCSPLYDADRPGLLFRVFYYKKRINLEVFHALADGMGAMSFLRTLVYYYLLEKHPDLLEEGIGLNDYDPSPDQACQDAFKKYYDRNGKVNRNKEARAYCPQGPYFAEDRIGVFEGTLSVRRLLEKAHQYHASMTEFLTAVLLCSIQEEMSVSDLALPVVITIPVDLRNFFPTRTERNFFALIQIRYSFKESGTSFPDVVAGVHKSFEEQLVSENMQEIINKYSALENNLFIRMIPLSLKIPCLRLAGRMGRRDETADISNMGRIAMPPELSSYIRSFSVIFSTNHPQICICSFDDTLAISYSSRLKNTDIPRCFFQKLAAMGIDLQISSNLEQRREEQADALL